MTGSGAILRDDGAPLLAGRLDGGPDGGGDGSDDGTTPARRYSTFPGGTNRDGGGAREAGAPGGTTGGRLPAAAALALATVCLAVLSPRPPAPGARASLLGGDVLPPPTPPSSSASPFDRPPLSDASPLDLGLAEFRGRPRDSVPGPALGPLAGRPLPTNEWYQSLLVGLRGDGGQGGDGGYASGANRAHALPYLVDAAGPAAGLRLHYPSVLGRGSVVEASSVPSHGLTLGALDGGFEGGRYAVDCDQENQEEKGCRKEDAPGKLGVGLRWDGSDRAGQTMRAFVSRGMAYGTVEYGGGVASPAVAAEAAPLPPVVDGGAEMVCGPMQDGGGEDGEGEGDEASSPPPARVRAEGDVALTFRESDFTWLVFFSRPVGVSCRVDRNGEPPVPLPPGVLPDGTSARAAFHLLVHDDLADGNGVDGNGALASPPAPLVVRIALANNCTAGTSVHFCDGAGGRDQPELAALLRERAHAYPTWRARVGHDFRGGEEGGGGDAESARLLFDWGAESWRAGRTADVNSSDGLLTYALPHHVDAMGTAADRAEPAAGGRHCARTLHGAACLVSGGLWAMDEPLGDAPGLVAARPPRADHVPAIARALSDDVDFDLPEYYRRGVGDTYFSGKQLAKLGRIVVAASELRDLAGGGGGNGYRDPPDPDAVRAARDADLPSERQVADAVARLRSGVEVWLNGTAGTPFTYDGTWGGVVSCGCLFNGRDCDNDARGGDCPAYADPGLDFGNGFYNDHHFHYGYLIYAAAVVAEHDREWAVSNFERVLLLVRDIANPSSGDGYFVPFRQKDWYLGSSWASGIALFGGRPYLNGRNQESSSEAIAAYEGVAVFGAAMVRALGGEGDGDDARRRRAAALECLNVGRLLAATEIRAADRYWHVYSPKRDAVYPDSYQPRVVGMMWDTMCQFQTWFGNQPYLAYGIQLLPLTPVSERRDTDQWLRQLYPSFAASCSSDERCREEGWAVLLYAVLAELGHADMALNLTLSLPESAFTSAGGNGHSLTNTLWYIASRPRVVIPYDLEDPSSTIYSKHVPESEEAKRLTCGCPESCTADALGAEAGGSTCKQRIQWLMANRGLDELGSCLEVAGDEFSRQCGGCNPELCADARVDSHRAGGAERVPSPVEDPNDSACPPCGTEICSKSRCQIETTPNYCYEGNAAGGCSASPWVILGEGGACLKCCMLYKGC